MNAVAGFSTGIGLGLACFGSLWLAVRRAARGRVRPGWLSAGRLARLLVAGAAFYALGREGMDILLAALGGFLVVRTAFIARMGSGS